jgi:hypothetical protein
MKTRKWIAEKIYTFSLMIENLAYKIYDPDLDYLDKDNNAVPDFNIMHTDAGHIVMIPSNEYGCDCEGCDCQ